MNFRLLLLVLLLAILSSGCCGMTNVQAHGGGAGGFASLGALVLGTTAMQRLCNTGEDAEPGDAPLPPDTDTGIGDSDAPDNKETRNSPENG